MLLSRSEDGRGSAAAEILQDGPGGADIGAGCGCSERICYCQLGFAARLQGEKGRRGFLEEAARVEEFLRDPWWVRAADGGGTVQVLVPRIVPAAAAAVAATPAAVDAVGGGDGGEYVAATSQTKRAALQKQAAAASVAAEDYVRRLEAGEVVVRPEFIGDLLVFSIFPNLLEFFFADFPPFFNCDSNRT